MKEIPVTTLFDNHTTQGNDFTFVGFFFRRLTTLRKDIISFKVKTK